LGHFLLADALAPKLRESRGRVVSVSSLLSMIGDFALDFEDLDWNRREYDPWYAYGASKAQNILFADEFARREGRNGIVANSLHPGIVTTNLVRYSVPDLVQSKRDLAKERESFVGRLAAKAGIRNPDEGGRTSVWLATSAEAALETGKFFIDPGLVYPGATREQLVEAGDWFVPSGTEFLSPQLHMPEKLFEWRTEANAAKLWSTSQEMVSAFTI
jgi:NAD(P)-dependent dehydrogenase (short-subunit alcohol dehydrogenase family)